VKLLGLMSLAISAAVLVQTASYGETSALENYTKAGKQALSKGNYEDAERQFRLALKEAELGCSDSCLTACLNDLAIVLLREHKVQDAAPVIRRALYIWHKDMGVNQPDAVMRRKNAAIKLLEIAKIELICAERQEALSMLWGTLSLDPHCIEARKTYNSICRKMADESGTDVQMFLEGKSNRLVGVDIEE
jgi:hypothetical protein